jgi:hypothetical protein
VRLNPPKSETECAGELAYSAEMISAGDFHAWIEKPQQGVCRRNLSAKLLETQLGDIANIRLPARSPDRNGSSWAEHWIAVG